MDKVRPTIIATYPHNCEECVSIYRTIKVVFHESIFPAENYEGIKITDVKGTEVNVDTYICENKLFIDICRSLEYDTKYYVLIPKNCVKDSDCNLFCPEYVFEFTTEKNKNLLFVTRTEPKNNDKCVDIDTNIIVNFNKIIIEGSAFENIRLASFDGTFVKIKKELCGTALKIDLCEDLEYETEYELFIPRDAVKDLNNITMCDDYTLEFRTEKEKVLFVVCTDPVNGEKDVDVCQKIVITFNTKIEEGRDYCKIKLSDEHGKCVELDKCIKEETLLLEAEKMHKCNKYFLEIPRYAIVSCEGKTLKADFNMSFDTLCC